jgi:molecular chaperone HtpG
VHGVVDTEDLPLNVSREMLQATPVLARIRRAVTNRVLSELKARAKDAADYTTFWENFGFFRIPRAASGRSGAE